MATDFEARRKALARAKEQADKAAKAAADAEAKRKKLAAQAQAMRDALIVDAVRTCFPGIDDTDDPVAFIREAMAERSGDGSSDADTTGVSTDDANAFGGDSDDETSDGIAIDALF